MSRTETEGADSREPLASPRTTLRRITRLDQPPVRKSMSRAKMRQQQQQQQQQQQAVTSLLEHADELGELGDSALRNARRARGERQRNAARRNSVQPAAGGGVVAVPPVASPAGVLAPGAGAVAGVGAKSVMGRRDTGHGRDMELLSAADAESLPPKTAADLKRLRDTLRRNFIFAHLQDEQLEVLHGKNHVAGLIQVLC